MKNAPWFIALIFALLIVAFAVIGTIAGFNDVISYGITALTGALIGLAVPQPTLS